MILYTGTDMALAEELMCLAIILYDFSLIYSLSIKGEDAYSPNASTYLKKKIEKIIDDPPCPSVCPSYSALMPELPV